MTHLPKVKLMIKHNTLSFFVSLVLIFYHFCSKLSQTLHAKTTPIYYSYGSNVWWSWLGSQLRALEGQNHYVSWAGGCGWKFCFQAHTNFWQTSAHFIVGLRLLFPCWLSARRLSELSKTAYLPAVVAASIFKTSNGKRPFPASTLPDFLFCNQKLL